MGRKGQCAVCHRMRKGLLQLSGDASCLFPDGKRKAVPKGSHVCPEHRPVSYMMEKAEA